MPKNRRLKANQDVPLQIRDRLTEKLRIGAGNVVSIGKELRLTDKQIKWAELYARYCDSRTIQDITMEAYPEASYASAGIQGSENRRHKVIAALVDILFVAEGLSDVYVSKELIKALRQDTQPAAKVAAAKVIFELTGRLENRLIIEQPKKEYDLSVLTEEQIRQWITINDILERSAKVQTISVESKSADDGGDYEEGTLLPEPL